MNLIQIPNINIFFLKKKNSTEKVITLKLNPRDEYLKKQQKQMLQVSFICIQLNSCTIL